jgi:hydrogenase-4 component B
MELIIPLLVFCFVAGFILPFLTRWREKTVFASLALAGAGSLAALISGICYLVSPMRTPVVLYRFPTLVAGFPVFTISFFADQLAAIFLILTGGVSLAACLHMVEWLRGATQRRWVAAVYNFFVISILMTILANTVFFYLLSLECITLTYAYLVLFRHNEEVDRKDVPNRVIEASKTAFKTYLIFEHVGLILLAVAFIILAIASNSFDFDRIHFVAFSTGRLSGTAANLVFVLGLLGFAIKAGAFPVHVWTPIVHPYSPTSIQAVASGVVLPAAGIYGMYRLFFEFSGPGELWWGLLVLVLGAASALVGVFYGLVGRDLKTALASHTVEHIGIILVGIGVALICRWAAGYPVPDNGLLSLSWGDVRNSFQLVAVLALVASLYHLINYSLFKSLLFFASGAIENQTGTTTLSRLGGLIKRYPWISATFIIGAVSIAGFPPFNGFISVWLTLQAIFCSMNLLLPGIPGRIFILLGMVAAVLFLALAIGMTALAFVKITGEALLGAPRDPAVTRQSRSTEGTWHIRSVLVVLAGLCLILGLFPAPVANELSQVAAGLYGAKPAALVQKDLGNLIITVPVYTGEKTAEIYTAQITGSFLWVLFVIILAPFLVNGVLSYMKQGGKIRLRRRPVWAGGEPYLPETMQYTGTAFSAQVWSALEDRKTGGRPGHIETVTEENYLPSEEPLTNQRAVVEVFRSLYDTGVRWVLKLAQLIGDWVQPGDIRQYLAYIFVMFILALVLFLMYGGIGEK